MSRLYSTWLMAIAATLAGSFAFAEVPLLIEAHEKDAWAVAFSPDGKHLASVRIGPDALKIWDTTTGKLVAESDPGRSGYNCVCFSPDGERIAVGTWAAVDVLEARTGKWARRLSPQTIGNVNGAVFSPDGSKIATVFLERNVVEVFDVKTGKHNFTLLVPMEPPAKGTGGISRVAFSPDGAMLVAACGGRGWPDFKGEDSVIAVWDAKTWKLIESYTASTHNINSLEISPDSTLVAASCHHANEVKVWRLPEPKGDDRPDPAVIAELITALDSDDFSEREKAERRLREIGLPAQKALTEALDAASAEAAFRARRILKDMKEEDSKLVHVVKSKSGYQSVAFSPDGKLLATGSHSKGPKSIAIWELGPPLRRIDVANEHGTWVVDFSPDGRRIAWGSVNGTVGVCEVEKLLAR